MARLYVICGHGAGDCGACGNGYQEAERVRTLGKHIKELGGDNVILGDINRNFYKDDGISHLTIPKDYQIIELHMDSAAVTARGAHVIIDAGMNADQFDEALADFLTGLFPGRSQPIVKRNNLANPARALAAGYGYRLVEIGFISNADDVAVFNANIDNIAKGILACFDIDGNATVKPQPAPTPAPQPSTGTKYGIGTSVYTETLASSSDGKGQVFTKDHYAGVIGRVIPGARYPYRIDKDGEAIGWTDDAGIDNCPHIPGEATVTSTTSNLKYGIGTKVCVQTLARSADGTAGIIPSHYTGTITSVYPGQPYPYLIDGNAGYVNDTIIDNDPHTPQ